MGRVIIKLHDKTTDTDYYLLWSTIVDAPVSYCLSLDECVNQYKQDLSEIELIDLPTSLKRLEETGSSGFGTLEDLLEFNEAGNEGKKLSKEEILQGYCRTKAQYTK